MKNNPSSIGIIGGGLMGMTLSLRLAESGLKVTLIESSDQLGGVASSGKIGDYIWDRFYHVVLLSDSHLLSLIDQLGLKDQLHWGVTKTGFYADGRLYSVSNFIEFLLFPPLNIFEKFRFGLTIIYASRIKNWKRLEKILATDWLQRHSGQRTSNKIWIPLLKSKLGDHYELASASFIWATISRLYAARRTGLKREMFGYISGGYRTVIERFQGLLENKGVNILCGTNVGKVLNEEAGVLIEIGRNGTLRFDKAVLTVPCPAILELCPQLTAGEATRLKTVVYQDLLCATFILKKPLSRYYITNIADGNIPFTGIIEMTALVDKAYFGGHSLIYLPRYLIKGDPFFDKSDETVKDIFLSSLKTMHPDLKADDLVAYRISRIVDFPIIPTLDYHEISLPSSLTSMNNIFIANSAQILIGTNNVNEIVGLANDKATELVPFLK
jgi:protoporphyrinogen oxidase